MIEYIEDACGNAWAKCGPGCHMEIVRPGKVQCPCDYDESSPHEDESGEDCIYCQEESLYDAMLDALDELPPVNDYGYCVKCKRRRGIGCACDMTFAEKIKTIRLDEEALRIFNMGGKGRKRGKDSADNKRNA